MNSDNNNHTATRPVPGLLQHNTAPRTRPASAAHPRRRRAFPALLSAVLMMAATGADLRAQPAPIIVTTETTAVGVNITLTAGGTLLNSGTIISTGTIAVHATGAGVLVSNSTNARIEGATHGVYLVADGTFFNAGTITGAAESGYGILTAGKLTGTNAGIIEGGTTGIQFNTGAANSVIINTGTIRAIGTADATAGIRTVNSTAITLTNTGAGLIQGGGYGLFLLTGGGTLFNSGTISGTAANSVGIYTSGTLTGTNAGLIQGTGTGIYVHNTGNASNSVFVNTGTIRATGETSRAFYVGANARYVTLDNQDGGLVEGGAYGVSLSTGGATITNSGTITGTAANGIGILTTGMLTVTNTGLIHGGSAGIHFNNNANTAGSAITNSGTITGTRGITSTGAAGSVTLTNTASGLIAGALYGVYLGTAGGVFYNSGTISGTNATGNTTGFLSTGKLTGTNTGIIAGSQFGINLNNTNADGSDITNTGTIRSTSSTINNNAGINVSQVISIIVTNSASGLIEGAYFGVQSTGGGTITNAGTISGTIATTGMGIRVSSTTAIENTGLVQGRQYGIQFNNADADGSTITNSGTILNTAGNGLAVSSQSLITVDNLNAGLIEGDTAGVYLATGGTVINAGLINTTANGWGVYIADTAGVTASVENQATGTIAGVYAGGTTTVVNDGVITGSGVWLSAASTLTGAGSINATGTALTLLDGANHTNTTMNLTGSEVGVSFIATGTLVNNARIEGTSRHGVEALNASALVTNNAAGLIQGGSYGVHFAVGGTVWNSGTITGTTAGSGIGISATGDRADITNDASGLIQGGIAGIYLAAGGTVTNAGAITGTVVNNSYGIYAEGSPVVVTNTTGALIRGAIGVYLTAGGTVTNSGTIISTMMNNNYGIYAEGLPAFITNTTGALIQGSSIGVWFLAGGTLVNSGTVTSIQGVYVSGAPVTITNTTGGLISGNSSGVKFDHAGGTISNSGTISSASSIGIYAEGASVTITNATGGLISGNNDSIYSASGYLTVTNSGTIISTTGNGIRAWDYATVAITNTTGALITGRSNGVELRGVSTLDNSGAITGTNGAGVTSTSTNTLTGTNTGPGLIQGGSHGVYLAAGGTMWNSGTITGTSATSHGIYAAAPALITNATGGLISGGSIGVNLAAGGSIANSGVIRGSGAGVWLDAGGSIANSGTIVGTASNRYGIWSGGAFTGTNSGLIQGGAVGIWLNAGGGTVWNSGTITGTTAGYVRGIYAGDSSVITNNTDALIQSGYIGIYFTAGGTVVNSGTIAGATFNGIEGYYNSVRLLAITNTTGGVIQGGSNGVYLAIGALDNSGVIIGTTGAGVSSTKTFTGTNTAPGLIQGGAVGINLAAGGTVWNSGTITGTTAATSHGIHASAAPAFVTNDAGALIRGGQNGVYLADGGALDNSGTISGTADTGVFALNAAVTVTNNAGARIEGGEVGVHLMNGGEITNAGLITAGLYNGVLLDAGGAVFNSGTILGNTSTNDDFNGIVTGQNPAYISNTTGALIRGGGNGVWLGAGGTVANSGTISGAVSNGIYAETASAFITNTTGGLITGGNNGLNLAVGGTVANSGALTGTAYNGIYAWGTPVSVTNAAGGSITGGQQGVWLSTGGDVTNAATALIHGGWRGMYFTAGGTLANSGTITGVAYDGVSTETAPVSITNNAGGLITGGQVGVALRAGGDVANAATALIHGGWYGVYLTDGGTVLNTGSITADYHGIFSENAPVTITNTTGGDTTGGLVQGVYYGVHLTVGGSVVNTGSIMGGVLGVSAVNTPVAVNNGFGGRISGGSADGIWMAAGGTVFNAGGIDGGSTGVSADTAAVLVTNTTGASISGGGNGVFLLAGGTVENAGRITGTGASGIGVYAEGVALVTNTTGGEILAGLEGVWFLAGGTLANSGVITGSSAIGDGVYAEGAPALVTNDAGRITGGDTGVYFGAGGTLFNSGTITGTTAATGIGVRSIGAFTGSNAAAGLLSGGQYGAHLAAGGALANSGTITGAVYNGVYAAGAPLLLTNDAGALVSGGYHGAGLYAGGTLVNAGVITGGVLGVSGSGAYVSLLNTGTINGGVNLTATVSSATLALGGKIDGGLAIAGGNGGADDTLTLDAADASGSQSHAAAVTGSTVFTGTLIKTGDGTWDLDANAADPASLAGLAQQATLVQAGTLAVDWTAHQLNAADPSAPPPAPATADIASGATLQIRKTDATPAAADVTLASPLTGAGYVDFYNNNTSSSSSGGQFALAATTGDAFTGTIGVRGATPANISHFLFDDNAETALTRATLRLGAHSETTLDADRTIGGLHLDDGRLFIATNTAAPPIVPHLLTVGTLSGAAGEFGLADEALTGLDLPRPPGVGALTAGIFDVDATGIAGNRAPIVKVTVSSPLGNATAFTLVNTATAPLGESGTMDFHDATGTDIIGKISTGYKAVYYDPADAGADAAPAGKGVYLDYGVTAIESTHDAIAVTLDPTGSADKTLSAKLTGTGAGFTFAGADTVTLAQLADHTGATLITGSAILKAGDGITDIIATSARVTLDGEHTGFDLGTANQTLRNLSGSGSIALRDATLTVNNTGYTGTLSGAITGGATGGLTLATGELTLTGAAAYAGATAVQTGAALTIGDGATLGALAGASRVTIAAGGTLALWRSDAITFANTVAIDAGGIMELKAGSGATALTGALTGDGTLVQNAAAPATLTGANDIDLLVNHGSVQIGNGGATGNGWATDTLDRAITLAGADAKLILNRAGALAIDTAITGAGGVDIIGAGGVTELQRAQTYTGATYARNNTLRAGAPNVLAASAGLTLENATLDLAGHNQTLRRLHGQGATGATVFYHTDQTQPAATPDAAYATLTTAELTGAITLNMNVDLAGRRADKLQVSTLATGSHHIVLRRTTTTAIDDARRTYALDILALPAGVSADPAVLDITSNDLEIGAHTYRLHRGDGGNAMPGTNLVYLSGGEARSRAGDAIYLTAAVAGLDWHYSLDSLRKRMGDLRPGGLPDTGSVWVTVNTSRLNAAASLAGDGFTQDSHSVTAGGDRRIDLPRGLTLLAGGFLSFARHDRDFDNHGSGETSGLGLGGYATVLHPDGWYGDFVLRADRSYNKLHAQSVDGFVTDARYGSDALGASLELGRRVTTGLFWLEPSMQAALVRLGGENYATERQTAYHEPIHVTIDGSTAAQYRLQLRAGVDLGRWRPNLRVAEVKSDTTGGALHVEGREWTPAFDGWRFETGLGASYLIDDQSQLYFDYEYNKAPAYERPWSLTLGYRRAW